MATNLEIRTLQKAMLFDLMLLKRDDVLDGILSKRLEILIHKTIATMEQEDVAWVQKQVSETPRLV